MRARSRPSAGLLVVVCSTIAAVPASAQQSTTLQEIVVDGRGGAGSGGTGDAALGSPTSYGVSEEYTGTKTRTPILKTPVSVQTVTQQVIKDQQATNIDQALQNVSGVSTIANGGTQQCYQIRGFTTCDFYLGGVRVRNNFTTPQRDIVDIQQVEVLKGPASILYGRQEPGGLINLDAKLPSAVASYGIEQQVGSYGFYRTTFNVTGPSTITPNLLFRLDGSYEQGQGFRQYGDFHHVFFAPRIRWEPTQDTRANLYVNFLNDRSAITSIVPIVNNQPALVPVSRNYGSPDAALRTKYDARIGYDITHDFNSAWSLTHRFNADFRDVPGIDTEPFAPDCTVRNCLLPRFVAGFTANKTQDYFTNLDLTGHFNTFGLGHTLLVGGDFLLSKAATTTAFAFSRVPPTFVFAPVPTGDLSYLLNNPDSLARGTTGEDWYGFYLQDQIALPYNFQLLAGLRYDNASSYSEALNTVPPPVSATSYTVRADAVKPRVGLLWQAIPQLSFYGQYVENFGVANTQNPTQAPLPPSNARAVEGGIKAKFLNDRVLATAAYFDITKTNVATPDPDIARASQGFLVATGAVRNKGVEFDIQGQLTRELRLTANYAHIDSVITADNSGNIGNRLYGVPRDAGSFWAVYSPGFEMLRGASFGAGVTARSSSALDNTNTVILPGYSTVNLMARYVYQLRKTRVTFQLNAYNVANTIYYQAENTGAGAFPGTPRTILGSVRAEF